MECSGFLWNYYIRNKRRYRRVFGFILTSQVSMDGDFLSWRRWRLCLRGRAWYIALHIGRVYIIWAGSYIGRAALHYDFFNCYLQISSAIWYTRITPIRPFVHSLYVDISFLYILSHDIFASRFLLVRLFRCLHIFLYVYFCRDWIRAFADEIWFPLPDTTWLATSSWPRRLFSNIAAIDRRARPTSTRQHLSMLAFRAHEMQKCRANF